MRKKKKLCKLISVNYCSSPFKLKRTLHILNTCDRRLQDKLFSLVAFALWLGFEISVNGTVKCLTIPEHLNLQ